MAGDPNKKRNPRWMVVSSKENFKGTSTNNSNKGKRWKTLKKETRTELNVKFCTKASHRKKKETKAKLQDVGYLAQLYCEGEGS